MVNSSTKPSTQDLVTDYINYKLSKAGYEYAIGNRQFTSSSTRGCSTIATEAPSQAHRILRMIGDQFETAYFNSFEDMTSSINVHSNDLKHTVYRILDVTFETGIQWGRIVGAFVFAAKVSVKAATCDRFDVVDSICEWTTNYLEEPKFSNWINHSGGWDGFVQYYKHPDRMTEQEHFTWTKACSFGFSMLNSAASFLNTMMS